jgi:hypothetical protein
MRIPAPAAGRIVAFLLMLCIPAVSLHAQSAPPVSFTRYIVDYHYVQTGDPVAGDFDNDGDVDIVAHDLEASRLIFNENAGGIPPEFI